MINLNTVNFICEDRPGHKTSRSKKFSCNSQIWKGSSNLEHENFSISYSEKRMERTVVLQLGSTPHWSNICAHSNAPSLAAAWSTLGPPDEEAKLEGLAPCFSRRWHMVALLALAARCKHVCPPSPVRASTSLPKMVILCIVCAADTRIEFRWKPKYLDRTWTTSNYVDLELVRIYVNL